MSAAISRNGGPNANAACTPAGRQGSRSRSPRPRHGGRRTCNTKEADPAMANPSPPSAHGAFRDSNAGPDAGASGGAGGRPPKALSIAGIDPSGEPHNLRMVRDEVCRRSEADDPVRGSQVHPPIRRHLRDDHAGVILPWQLHTFDTVSTVDEQAFGPFEMAASPMRRERDHRAAQRDVHEFRAVGPPAAPLLAARAAEPATGCGERTAFRREARRRGIDARVRPSAAARLSATRLTSASLTPA